MAFPTETVYGLGAHALDAEAVAKIFAAKERPEFDPLIVHVADVDWVGRLVAEVPELARKLMDRFWPGPLTLVLPKRDAVPDLVTSGLGSVGIRQPRHKMALEVLREADLPLAAPSANLFGRISPTTATHVADQLADRVDYILDGGSCEVGVESTVVTIAGDDVVVLRPGGVTLEELREVTPSVRFEETDGTETIHVSPGRTLQHYAPQTRLVIRENLVPAAHERGLRIGALSIEPLENDAFAICEQLPNDLVGAAAGFFAALRRLDAADLDLILATPFPNHGLGVALNDRLRRAAFRTD